MTFQVSRHLWSRETETKPENEHQKSKNCVNSIPCECEKTTYAKRDNPF